MTGGPRVAGFDTGTGRGQWALAVTLPRESRWGYAQLSNGRKLHALRADRNLRLQVSFTTLVGPGDGHQGRACHRPHHQDRYPPLPA